MTKIFRVFLSRFSPLHKGHQSIIDKLIRKYKFSNVLILVGSSNSQDERTPFTYQVRKRMIKTIYPKLKVLPLPDSKKNIKKFTEVGDKIWLAKIKKLEHKLNAKFIFYGGRKEELETLSVQFKTYVLIDRTKHKVSGTEIRKLISKGDYSKLKNLLHPDIFIYIKNYSSSS